MGKKTIDLTSVRIGAPDEKTQSLTIHLYHIENGRAESIAVPLSYEMFAYLTKAFQQTQAKHKLPIPSTLRPSRPPALSVVVDD